MKRLKKLNLSRTNVNIDGLKNLAGKTKLGKAEIDREKAKKKKEEGEEGHGKEEEEEGEGKEEEDERRRREEEEGEERKQGEDEREGEEEENTEEEGDKGTRDEKEDEEQGLFHLHTLNISYCANFAREEDFSCLFSFPCLAYFDCNYTEVSGETLLQLAKGMAVRGEKEKTK